MLIAEQLKNLDDFKEKYKNLLYSHYFRSNYYVHFGAFYSNVSSVYPKHRYENVYRHTCENHARTPIHTVLRSTFCT